MRPRGVEPRLARAYKQTRKAGVAQTLRVQCRPSGSRTPPASIQSQPSFKYERRVTAHLARISSQVSRNAVVKVAVLERKMIVRNYSRTLRDSNPLASTACASERSVWLRTKVLPSCQVKITTRGRPNGTPLLSDIVPSKGCVERTGCSRAPRAEEEEKKRRPRVLEFVWQCCQLGSSMPPKPFRKYYEKAQERSSMLERRGTCSAMEDHTPFVTYG
ncbi:hypothetical protein C8R45DRAFT_926669 [Mycena sanguinolenta]|nr:hypothetical protein C8R45DRAFT_926669 [Mycena sanguinolenta]